MDFNNTRVPEEHAESSPERPPAWLWANSINPEINPVTLTPTYCNIR